MSNPITPRGYLEQRKAALLARRDALRHQKLDGLERLLDLEKQGLAAMERAVSALERMEREFGCDRYYGVHCLDLRPESWCPYCIARMTLECLYASADHDLCYRREIPRGDWCSRCIYKGPG